MPQTLSDALAREVFSRLPPDRPHGPADFDAVPLLLARALRQRLADEVDARLAAVAPWVGEESDPWVSAARAQARYPADDWREAVRAEAERVVATLIAPAREMAAWATPNGTAPIDDVLDRMRQFGAYPYLTEIVGRYAEKKEIDAIDGEALEQLLNRIDRRLAAELDVEGWMALLAPLYDVAEAVPELDRELSGLVLGEVFSARGLPGVGSRLVDGEGLRRAELRSRLRDILDDDAEDAVLEAALRAGALDDEASGDEPAAPEPAATDASGEDEPAAADASGEDAAATEAFAADASGEDEPDTDASGDEAPVAEPSDDPTAADTADDPEAESADAAEASGDDAEADEPEPVAADVPEAEPESETAEADPEPAEATAAEEDIAAPPEAAEPAPAAPDLAPEASGAAPEAPETPDPFGGLAASAPRETERASTGAIEIPPEARGERAAEPERPESVDVPSGDAEAPPPREAAPEPSGEPLWARLARERREASGEPEPEPDEDAPGATPLWKQFATGGADAGTSATLADSIFQGDDAPTTLRDAISDAPRGVTRPEDHEAIVLGDAAENGPWYVETLFGGDAEAYAGVLALLVDAGSWTDATQIIGREVFRRYKINIYSEPAVSFTGAVEARYQSR